MGKFAASTLVVFIVILQVAGCAGVETYSSIPKVQKVSNEYYTAEIEPQLKKGQAFYNSFRFALHNRTQVTLNIDWEKTAYLYNGLRHGRFLWQGVDWNQLKEVRSQSLISVAPGDTFTKVIFPAQLVGRSPATSRYGVQYVPGVLPAGKNGIYLVVWQNGNEIHEKIMITIEVGEQ